MSEETILRPYTTNNFSINKVHRSVKELLGILNDILDFSKIESDKLEIDKIDFRLEDVSDTLSDLVGIKVMELLDTGNMVVVATLLKWLTLPIPASTITITPVVVTPQW